VLTLVFLSLTNGTIKDVWQNIVQYDIL